MPFDFEGPEWEDGFFFCVGGCRGAVLTLVFSFFLFFSKTNVQKIFNCSTIDLS